jgi:hypothetical protein
MTILHLLINDCESKTKIWAVAFSMVQEENNQNPWAPQPNYVVLWGVLQGRLSSRRMHGHPHQFAKMARAKQQAGYREIQFGDREKLGKVEDHLHKQLAWEQLAGIPKDYSYSKMQFD